MKYTAIQKLERYVTSLLLIEAQKCMDVFDKMGLPFLREGIQYRTS